MVATQFDDKEKHVQWLEKIANTLETNSSQFVTMRHHDEFQTFLAEKDRGELTADQLASLERL
jgi:hypothetical protein